MSPTSAVGHRSRRGRCLSALAAALGCLAVGLWASAATAAPSEGVAAAIERMMVRLGGREAIAELHSLAAEADCSGPGGTFQTRVESLRPGAVYFHQREGDRATEIWSTAERTWWRNAEGELSDLDDGARSFVRGHEFHLLLFELETRFTSHRLSGDATSERSCRRLDMEDSSGQPAAICLRESDGLPISLEMNPAGAEGAIVVRFEDWREIEGILYFHSFVLTEGPDRTFTYRYVDLEPNGVAASRFASPSTKDVERGR